MLAQYFSHFFPIKDPVIIFALVLILMLGSPIVMARFNLPSMIGLLLAGAVLGPNGFGILARDQSFILLGTVGLLYIMFTAALEVDLAVFKRYRVQGVVFGVLTFSVPQGLGTLGSYYLLGFDWPAAILLASMFASHTLLAYPIVSRLGLSKNQAVTTTIGGTMVTDTAALMVLAVIAGSTTGEVNETFWWKLGGSLTVFVTVVLVGLPRIGRWFFRRMAKDGPGEFVFVLASVFICAGLSELAGVEPIVGAFLAGIALNRLIPHNGALMNRLVFTGEAIFIPFFLLSVGMLLDSKVLFGGVRTWIVAGFMIGTVTLTKFLAAEGARFVFGFSVHEGRVMFGLSVAQAAATLAAVIVGHEIGLFDETVVNGTIMMILATCVLGPWMVERHAKKIVQATQLTVIDDLEHQRTLIPITDVLGAKPATNLAILLRGSSGSPLYPLFVAKDGEGVAERVAEGEHILSEVTSLAASADVPTQPATRVDTVVADAITRARKELRITEIVASWDGIVSSEERMFGSVLDAVVADAATTTCVIHQPQALNISTRVLLLVPPRADLDPCFERGVSMTKRIGGALGAPVVAMVVGTDERKLYRRLKRVRPPCKVLMKPLEDWDGLLATLAERVQVHDLVVMLGIRPSSEVFDEGLLALPRRLVSRFPDNNLIMIFPADAPLPSSGLAEPEPEPEVALVSSDQIILSLDELSLEGVVARVAGHARARWPNSNPIEESSFPSMIDGARELAPGVILMRYRDRYLDEASLWLGVSRGGVTHDKWQAKGHLFFVLFGPDGRDSIDLSEMIQRVRMLARNAETTDKIRFSTNLKQAREALRSGGLVELEGAQPDTPAGKPEVHAAKSDAPPQGEAKVK